MLWNRRSSSGITLCNLRLEAFTNYILQFIVPAPTRYRFPMKKGEGKVRRPSRKAVVQERPGMNRLRSSEAEIASSWITQFAEHLSSKDAQAIASLFLPDGWLRDFLVFQWDLRTLHGHDQILGYMSTNLQNPNSTTNQTSYPISDVTLASDEYFKPSAGGFPGSVTAGFTFSTPIANGRGSVTLFQESSGSKVNGHGEWRASTVFVTLDSLKGHEEEGALKDIYLRNPTWSESRDIKWKQASEDPEVLIIGAGQSGLQIAARFQQMRIPTLVIEKGVRVGDVWRHRYASLILHTPKSHHAHNWPEWTPGHKLADWMEQYSINQDLLVWTESQMLPPPVYNHDQGKWTVSISRKGQIVTLHPKHLILATGFLGSPNIPTFSGQDRFQGRVLHSGEFNSGNEFAGKRCVVLGAGNSGADIALDLSTRGAASVLMVQRSSTCIQPATTVMPGLKRAWPEDVPVEVSDFRSYAIPMRRLLEILAATRHLSWDQEKDLIEGLQKAGLNVNMGINGAGVLSLVYTRYAGTDIGCGERIISGHIKVKSGVSIQELSETSVIFDDGSTVEADVVILATGYRNMIESLATFLGKDVLSQTTSLPTTGIDEEGELEAGYKPVGHPGLWFAPGSFPNARMGSKYLGIQIQAMKLGYMPTPKRANEEIRSHFPGAEEVIVQYLSGYLVDDAGEEEDILAVAREMLESLAGGPNENLENLMNRLGDLLEDQLTARQIQAGGPKLQKLDHVLDMSKTQISNTLALGEGVDLESINKGKASKVDVKKLEKQEAKLKAKIEKRARRDLYEGSRLLDAHRKQQTYEEMFMKINPLESAGSRNKNKDIHLPSIDVNFGSNRILLWAFMTFLSSSGASLTLAYGRRYGLIGRNGSEADTLYTSYITSLTFRFQIIGDDTTALESVLKADVWRDHLLREESILNGKLSELEAEGGDDKRFEDAREESQGRLAEVHARLAEMDAESGPARAGALLAGLGFDEADQQRPTKSFSGGWRMRLALARALMAGRLPANMVRDYIGGISRSDAVATDIVHQHSGRLDYYKGNFTQFYSTKSERDKNMRKEYEAQMDYRKHLQAFIDRWRYNANRAAQAQSKIKILEKLPELEPPEEDETEKFKFPETEKISPPLLQMSEVTFGYSPDKIVLRGASIDVGLDSRIAIVGANGSGKSTLIKILTGELNPIGGQVNRNGRLRIGYFAQHHVDSLVPNMSPVQFLASKFPGKTEQEYRQHLGNFQISGMTGLVGFVFPVSPSSSELRWPNNWYDFRLQQIGTLSGGQKSRVAFAVLSLQRPHVLLLDEASSQLRWTNPSMLAGLDALMEALTLWNGGVIIISHDERFITKVAQELWVCANDTVSKFKGDVESYKNLIVSNIKLKP
ncbi:hypothetical protein D9757_007882 [Collybiopsis confluens]|uniref:ABC transporter domain-containing protein n=1 Tax=Collybiopsis confluens TaxID=2823264 RepID=A0A8H5HDC8_9AGAR|nr:hypothetical protein D9757_007882 [Collybiopsis confluens]